MRNTFLISLALSAIFLGLFGATALSVLSDGWLVAVDQWVLARMAPLTSPAATAAMKAVTSLGGTLCIGLCCLAAAGYSLSRKRFIEAAGLAAVVMGSFQLHNLLKILFHRPRPVNTITLAAAHGWSFPSGHAMDSTAFYGMLAFLLVKAARSRAEQAMAVAAAAAIVLAVGCSRLYLQVHYASDVLAGFAGGLFWLTVCITGMKMLIKRQILSNTL